MTPRRRARPATILALSIALVITTVAIPAIPAMAQELVLPPESDTPAAGPTGTRSGSEIYKRFREGLADTQCESGVSHRWRQHYANAPRQMAAKSDDVLPLFGYVVDALRKAHLPTEYALIPFVESGYRPGARSAGGPAGLWQMIGVTARNHGIVMGDGYDGRLSPVDSTQAAVRYLKTLHGMFAGDWRLAVMAYNAGEYRVFGALKRSGQRANAARPDELVGLSDITRAYVRKLHALSCLLDQADDRDEWLRSLDRAVPVLAAVALPSGTTSLDVWAKRQDVDAGLLRRMNPAFPDGRVGADSTRRVLAPAASGTSLFVGAITLDARVPTSAVALQAAVDSDMTSASDEPARSHTVTRGESAWSIAQRYGLDTVQLLEGNSLNARSVLRPGMVLKLTTAKALP